MIIGLVGSRAATTETAGSGFAMIRSVTSSAGSGAAEDEVLTSTLSSATVSFGTSTSNWAMMVDAIQKAGTGTGTFGYNQIGGSYYTINGMILGSQYTIPTSGTAQSITAYFRVYGGSGANVKAAIYTTSGVLVGQTEQRSLSYSSSANWYTFNFLSGNQPSLTAGTTYVLVLWSNNDVRFYRDTTGSVNVDYQTIAYGTWPNPATFSTSTNEYSIYCTYSVP
jgi:hypothetical protein